MTFFWGTLFFVLLTLDVIPGLAELVSLVSEPFQMLQKEPPQAPLSACMHSGLISMHVVRESVIGVDACDACKAFTCPHRNVAESQGSSPSTRQACYGPFGMGHQRMLGMFPAGKRTSKPGVEVCGAWRCQLDSDQSLGAAAAEILPFA